MHTVCVKVSVCPHGMHWCYVHLHAGIPMHVLSAAGRILAAMYVQVCVPEHTLSVFKDTQLHLYRCQIEISGCVRAAAAAQ